MSSIFHRSNAAPAAPAATPAPGAPPRSRYAGITCADTRDPMIGCGIYRVKIVAATEGRNPGTGRESFKTTIQVVAAGDDAETAEGTACTMVSLIDKPPALAELKRMAMHAAGFGPSLEELHADPAAAKRALLEGEAAYDAAEPYPGAVLEATAGHSNGAPSLVGRLVDVVVSRGKDVLDPKTKEPTGDYYRVYRWGRVDEQ